MPKNKIGEDSPIPKFIYLKIRRRDGVESLTTLEEGEFKVPIDGCIKYLTKDEIDFIIILIGYRGDELNCTWTNIVTKYSIGLIKWWNWMTRKSNWFYEVRVVFRQDKIE